MSIVFNLSIDKLPEEEEQRSEVGGNVLLTAKCCSEHVFNCGTRSTQHGCLTLGLHWSPSEEPLSSSDVSICADEAAVARRNAGRGIKAGFYSRRHNAATCNTQRRQTATHTDTDREILRHTHTETRAHTQHHKTHTRPTTSEAISVSRSLATCMRVFLNVYVCVCVPLCVYVCASEL